MEATDVSPPTDDRHRDERHRLANLFHLLSTASRLRAQRPPEPAARAQLTWMVEAIAAIGVAQQQLIRPDGDDFTHFLQDMLPHWRRRCEGRPVTVTLQAEPMRVGEQNLSALALIAHELTSNALVHAFSDDRPGVLRIDLRRIEQTAVFTVTDDGRGYDPATIDNGRLGLWLLKGLSSQLHGRLITSATSAGVDVRLEFPAPVIR